MRKSKINSNRGITLIALVITIIVLLILVAVSIATLTGENGILFQAIRAGEETNNATEKEQIALAYNAAMGDNNGKGITQSYFEAELKKYDNGIAVQPNGDDLTVTFPSKNEYTVSKDGLVEGPKIIEANKLGKPYKDTGIYTENSTIDGKGASENNPIIPKGFKPVQTETSSWTGEGKTAPEKDDVKNGLVIQDNQENEFVWIPVPDVTEMANKITDKTEPDSNGNEYYEGKLYDFNSMTDITEKTEYGQKTISFREPAYLSSTSYDDNITYNNGLFTEESLQKDYNSMIASVKKYKGFYVGRYEMSKDFASKKGETSANAGDSETNMWYGLYNKAKSFYLKENSNIAVVGSMIWGSQYDRMMIWMKDNSIDVTKTIPIPEAKENTGSKTGTEENDKLNNIYDLLGNRYDWTLEAHGSGGRILRGVNSSDIHSPSNLNGNYPYVTTSFNGTRLTLYIK